MSNPVHEKCKHNSYIPYGRAGGGVEAYQIYQDMFIR